MIDACLAYLHYLGVMGLFAVLVVQHVLVDASADGDSARRLVHASLAFWAALLLVLVSGFIRLVYFGKGLAFYVENPLFHVKMSLVLGAAILAAYPSMEFWRTRGQIRHGNTSGFAANRARRVTWAIRLQLAIVILIPLTAVLMGRGFGY